VKVTVMVAIQVISLYLSYQFSGLVNLFLLALGNIALALLFLVTPSTRSTGGASFPS
jgi:hypothetical protein